MFENYIPNMPCYFVGLFEDLQDRFLVEPADPEPAEPEPPSFMFDGVRVHWGQLPDRFGGEVVLLVTESGALSQGS